MRADAALLKPFFLAALSNSDEALLASVRDAVSQTDGLVEELAASQAAPAANRVLALRELVQYEVGTAAFRTLAMAHRLARSMNMKEWATATGPELEKRVRTYQREARLVTVPLSASTDLKIAAILATARSLDQI